MMDTIATFGLLGINMLLAVRGDCDVLKGISFPLEGDTTLSMPTGYQACDIARPGELEEFVIEGGVLTLSGPSTATFANLRFTVMYDAGLIFDFDLSEFGPNAGYELEEEYSHYMLDVMDGGYAEFSGEMSATGVDNYFSVFRNNGTMEFKSGAYFRECGTSVFRVNSGKLRFRGDVIFEKNPYLGIRNEGGSVRIAGESIFNDTGSQSEETVGAAFTNTNDGTAIFDGLAIFEDNVSDYSGGAVFNWGKMKFYSKARFYNNTGGVIGGSGGAAYNRGTLKFFGAVQMIGNTAQFGGGLGTSAGGYTRFSRWTTITDNTATSSGGAMSVFDADEGAGSFVEFSQPSKVRISANRATGDLPTVCDNIALGESSELIGYELDGDICSGS